MGFLLPSGCASSSDEDCTFERSIANGEIGPIRSGSSLDELRKDYNVAILMLPYSDTSGYEITLCDNETAVLVETDAADVVISMSSTSASFQTDSGGRVGMSLAQLQRLHPEGVVSTGVEESGWIAFRLTELSGYFEFGLDGVKSSCLQENQTCTSDFYERPAIRYWAVD